MPLAVLLFVAWLFTSKRARSTHARLAGAERIHRPRADASPPRLPMEAPPTREFRSGSRWTQCCWRTVKGSHVPCTAVCLHRLVLAQLCGSACTTPKAASHSRCRAPHLTADQKQRTQLPVFATLTTQLYGTRDTLIAAPASAHVLQLCCASCGSQATQRRVEWTSAMRVSTPAFQGRGRLSLADCDRGTATRLQFQAAAHVSLTNARRFRFRTAWALDSCALLSDL